MESPISCALCDSLGSNNGSFSPNTDDAKKNHARIHFTQLKILDDGITEAEILRRCFAMRQPKVELSAATASECRQSLLNLCKSLIKHRTHSATTVVCNMCESGISRRRGNAHGVLNHACAHLDVKLFKCRHCIRSWSSMSDNRHHIRRAHQISKPTAEDFEDKTVDYFEEIFTWIKRCFSSSHARASGHQRQFVTMSDCGDKSQRSINHFCHSIFIQRSKPKSLECNLCAVRIGMRKNRFDASAMHYHAATHLDVKLFTCRHCNRQMSTICTMRLHLRNVHQILDGSNHDYDDRTEKFQTEYLNMIKRCYSADPGKLEVSIKHKSKIKAEAAIRCQATGSEQSTERRLFYNRLIRNGIDPEGKVKCHICSKRFNAKLLNHPGSISTNPFWHAEKHLQKPLYRCKVCKCSFITQRITAYHLKTTHTLGMKKNHECIADEFHEEIMAMFSKCYAPKG